MVNAAEDGKGVIIAEGAAKSDKSLSLKIIRRSDNMLITRMDFPIRIVDVEDIYRHVNMRAAMGGDGGNETQTGEPPEYPDHLTNGEYVAYSHGYNVDGAKGRESTLMFSSVSIN